MISLERFRDDPLLLDAFESNIANWVEGIEDSIPDLDGVSRNLLIGKDIRLPDELRKFWAIAKRWKHLPILGDSNGGHFESKPRFVTISDKSKLKELSKKDSEFPNRSDHYVMMISGRIAACRCCGKALRIDPETDTWLMGDIDDKNLRETIPFTSRIYLLEWGLRHFSHVWYSENEPNEFEVFAKQAKAVWKCNDREYWFHEDGIFGQSFEYMGTREHQIAVQSKQKVTEMIGRELVPPPF